MSVFTIREARREDCTQIRQLVQDLADMEKMPNGPKITVKDLEKDGFDRDPPYFYTYVAELSSETKEDAVVPDKGKDVSMVNGHHEVPAGESQQSSIIIGFAIYYFSYSTWTGRCVYLEDLYVIPKYRKQGVGAALFTRVAKRCHELGCQRLDFAVLNWNPAQDFYKKLGAVNITNTESWEHFRLSDEALENLVL
uniref:N-acetyltransferase domain-containing protein n=1 Tax=Timema bartmani TaxID=61472 RepID=A0A7R9ENP1_9NEOP|nr:unnamed protein product [Timema bartmani]